MNSNLSPSLAYPSLMLQGMTGSVFELAQLLSQGDQRPLPAHQGWVGFKALHLPSGDKKYFRNVAQAAAFFQVSEATVELAARHAARNPGLPIAHWVVVSEAQALPDRHEVEEAFALIDWPPPSRHDRPCRFHWVLTHRTTGQVHTCTNTREATQLLCIGQTTLRRWTEQCSHCDDHAVYAIERVVAPAVVAAPSKRQRRRNPGGARGNPKRPVQVTYPNGRTQRFGSVAEFCKGIGVSKGNAHHILYTRGGKWRGHRCEFVTSA